LILGVQIIDRDFRYLNLIFLINSVWCVFEYRNFLVQLFGHHTGLGRNGVRNGILRFIVKPALRLGTPIFRRRVSSLIDILRVFSIFGFAFL